MQKEISKLLKQLSAAKLRGAHKECIELNNIIGGLYSEIGSYDEAIHHHQEALDLCKTLGDRLNTALCHRYIGEGKASLGSYDEAIKHIRIYVELAQKINDQVESQRAWTTLGRIFLMQAQSLHEGEKTSAREKSKKSIAREAEKHFQTALNMAESVRDHIDDKEYSSMISGLLINMGIIKDIRGLRQEATVKFNRAAETCKSKKLKEDLYRCLAIASPIYRRWNETKMAVKASEEALTVAKSIGKKILICESFIEVGFTRICQRDFKNAKRAFAQAYLEKSPSEDDNIKAIKLTKLAHLISTTFDTLSKETTASESRIKLCDKLGDLFVAIGNYYLAAEFYRQAFLSAKACSVSKGEQARLLFSVAECYSDTEQYKHALLCFEKEASLREGNPKEQSATYIKIAHMKEYLDRSGEEVCLAYEKALEKAGKDLRLMRNVLRWYVPYLESKSCNMSRLEQLQEMLDNVESYPEVSGDIEEEEGQDYEEAIELEDEIANVDDVITDDEDNDEVLMIGRRRTKGSSKFKQNEVGDTPLHEAAIKGDLRRVKSLINQGHEVNPRDNAGWIPLHESCNHGHYQIAEFLIEKGADVNNRGLKGVTPLHDSATNGHYEIMRLLIKNGANVLMLTDTGENVLTCLRDYKSRNYGNMSNSELSEYKQMEAELLNIMDKCGHSLMSENLKQPKRLVSSGSAAAAAANVAPPLNQERPSLSARGSVKQYRDAMVTLKRKRPLEVSQPSKKASQPATVSINYNPSISTKNWLLEDEEDQIENENQGVDESFDENYDEIEDEHKNHNKGVNKSHDKDVIELDEEDDRGIDELEEETQRQEEKEEDEVEVDKNNKEDHHPFNLGPIAISIGDRRLLVPVKGENMTVGELKESIVDRYSLLVNSRPKISLAPKSDSKCLLFDQDLCKEVIREDLVANIISWQMPSILDSYLDHCKQADMAPLDFVKVELRNVLGMGPRLDLSHVRLPVAHREAVLRALTRRDFTTANLQGSVSLLERYHSGAAPQTSTILDTIATWSKLSRLNLKCTGLLRADFERLCAIPRGALPDLLELDVSYNSIVYNQREDFANQVERLHAACPKVKRVDVSRNIMKFATSFSELNADERVHAHIEVIL